MPDMSYPAAHGGMASGYLAVPSGDDGPWPGVVVIHEIFGLNADIRGKADQLAARGYLALAPDLYGGRPWIRCVAGAIGQVRRGAGPAFDALDGARAYLGARQDCTGKTGVIGFCLGGGFALLCAPRPGFDVAAVNYGDIPDDPTAALAGACPVVASFGARDKGIKAEKRGELEQALAALEIPHDVKLYPDSGHRFMSQASGAGAMVAKIAQMTYQPEDAADAWDRIYAFFGQYLS
ncbi:MAG: dienelactone hydrolase family protein [Streptosporangiaceae bacterium]